MRRFFCKKLKARNTIGSWVGAGGDERPIQTSRRTPMDKKFMAIVAVTQREHHFFQVLARNEHVNAEMYIQFLIDLENFLMAQRNPIRPENDNARPHAARATAMHIESRNIRHLRQPPYSPDVNLCDRYIFPRLEALTTEFQTMDDVTQFLNEQLPKFTSNRMAKALDNMISDMQIIIDNGGSYI